ncbi:MULTISPECIES: FKBP-type peptidyl-prolyl cis-trans isomerase [unclassified Mycobacterium]|uniref:FKBP-type peptidyl-prolyl cis-trans isomerase n=1 Tax=unclassified Mycobacterium TaxID=2642494 RepID=UPI001560769F|nr:MULTISPECIES: FKBP-type peptidyl-prolyl cis-trans isomerase [unclassified Mycobacterium]
MNLSRMSSSVALAACAASLTMTLAGCGSDTEASSTTTTSSTSTSSLADEFIPSVTETADPAAATCPTAAPQGGGTPEWTFNGDTGSVAVTGSTATAAPLIEVEPPFSVSETQVHTLQAGDGPVVADTATVFVCYMGVNGRDGSVFDNSYERGMPVDFPLDGVVPGFQKAIAGQKVGSTVAVAMTSADGYPEGQPTAGIQPGDSLIFAIKILDASR